ncbi:MAG: hypothetical protein M1825_001240 [Sarcosagium campestre]|nr:MAG: hypothetical protein M1825_001240 [Sarcosagium campestre]
MSTPSTYKPSPLSFGSPRTSPFRRPESPASPSIAAPVTTPTPSPKKTNTTTQSLGKSLPRPSSEAAWTPRGLSSPSARDSPASPVSPARTVLRVGGEGSDALSKLQPAQVRELREAFQLLDGDGDGQVTRNDVAETLTNLGQDATSSAIATFFPPGAPQTLSLPNFLTQISTLLAHISPAEELIAAFEAFDEDDNGQIDVGELRDAILRTAPEHGQAGRTLSETEVDRVLQGFTGRKAFGKKSGPRGDVFRYNDFVGAVSGGGGGKNHDKANDAI